MLCIDSRNTNPWYNLAAEEYLLRNSEDDIFMIWQSMPSVITGKHQNVLAEINYQYIHENNITVARRLTGGGTVYHDEGNINFTFIREGEQGRLVDFASFIEPVKAFLTELGVDAKKGPKHEILAGDKKFSGNAEHVYKNRVLHHGTLLFNSNLEKLQKAIDHTGGRYTHKAVQSNRSSVINLADCIRPSLSTVEFRKALFNFIMKTFNGRKYVIDEKGEVEIKKLIAEKYATWEWIFGWSPDYSFNNTWKNAGLEITVGFSVHQGIIRQAAITSGGMDTSLTGRLSNRITGIPHSESAIRNILKNEGMDVCIGDSQLFDDLVFAFF